MPCRLCLRDRPLRNSHIASEFLYRELYDEKHRAFQADALKGGAPSLIQKGLREPLLCTDCERDLNDRFEKPFLTAWRGRLRPARIAAQSST